MLRSAAKDGVEPMPPMRSFSLTLWQRPQLNMVSFSPGA
jgi:hypothetical protein